VADLPIVEEDADGRYEASTGGPPRPKDLISMTLLRRLTSAPPTPTTGGTTVPTLREAREERGWSPDDLAARSGVPVDAIAGLETGQREQLDRHEAEAVARVLGLDASTVYELRPSLGLSAVGETGSGEDAATGAGGPAEA
jgi:hypothetical protein